MGSGGSGGLAVHYASSPPLAAWSPLAQACSSIPYAIIVSAFRQPRRSLVRPTAKSFSFTIAQAETQGFFGADQSFRRD